MHTRYINSAFLGHASADHILQSILEITTGLELRKLIQVSMDGPNVNWKFHRLLEKHMESTTASSLLDGRCGLHIVHTHIPVWRCCFWLGLTEAAVVAILPFKDMPARREDFM